MPSRKKKFGRPLIGSELRKRYNVALDPKLKKGAQGSARSEGQSFSMWLEQAAQERMDRERTDCSVVDLHGSGIIELPMIGYSGGVQLDFHCGESPRLTLQEPSDFEIGSMKGTGTGTGHLELGGERWSFESKNFVSFFSHNRCPELQLPPQGEMILRKATPKQSSRYRIFLSNVDVDSDASAVVRGTEINLKAVFDDRGWRRLVRWGQRTAMVTAECTLTFEQPPSNFLQSWGYPIAKFLQTYSGKCVDVVAWSRLNDSGQPIEFHLLHDKASPMSSGFCSAQSEIGFIEWQPFFGEALGRYMHFYRTKNLGAFSQYMAMAESRNLTVNAKSALLLLAAELIANSLGTKLKLVFVEDAGLYQKTKAILDKTRLPMSKPKRQLLLNSIRSDLRNSLFHTGLPKGNTGATLQNARVNWFLRGFALSLHSILIGNQAPHHYFHWDDEFHLTPEQWLRDEYAPE